MSSNNTQLVILGAGYAGLMAALRLSGKTRGLNRRVLLINGDDSFVQRPRLHHVATGQPVPRTSLAELLRGTAVDFRQGWVTALNPDDRQVQVQTEQGVDLIGYDILVYALGSKVDQQRVPGVPEHAYVLDPSGANGTAALQRQLQALAGRRAQLVVVGGGSTGIEGATEIKANHPHLDVSLVTSGRFAAFKGERVETHIRDAFTKQGIAVHEGERVLAVEAGCLQLAGGRTLPFDLCLWAGGFRALPLAREAGFTVNERDQILVDPYGRALAYAEVYAVGDAAQPVEEPGVPLRMSLTTAITRGAHAADNITALLEDKAQTPLSFAYYGQGIALGPEDAVGFASYPADKPLGFVLRGKTAVHVRNFFVWLIFYFLKLERRWPGFYFWLGKGRYGAARKARAHTASPGTAALQGGDGHE